MQELTLPNGDSVRSDQDVVKIEVYGPEQARHGFWDISEDSEGQPCITATRNEDEAICEPGTVTIAFDEDVFVLHDPAISRQGAVDLAVYVLFHRKRPEQLVAFGFEIQ